MGRLCTFNDSSVMNEALSASWETCVQNLMRYSNMSSVAEKSSRLLQESSRRLLLKNRRQKVSPETDRLAGDFADRL